MSPLLKLRLFSIFVVLAVIGIFVYSYISRGDKIDILKKTTVVQQVANDTLTKTIQIDTKIEKVNNELRVKVAKKVAAIDKSHDEVVSKVEKEIVAIDTEYNLIPTVKTQEQIDAHDTEISTVLINGLWDQYCATMNTDSQCKANTI